MKTTDINLKKEKILGEAKDNLGCRDINSRDVVIRKRDTNPLDPK